MAQIRDMHTLLLRPDVSAADFEQFMAENGFPMVHFTRAGSLIKQSLLKDLDQPGQYIWVVEWELHFNIDPRTEESGWLDQNLLLDRYCIQSGRTRLVEVQVSSAES